MFHRSVIEAVELLEVIRGSERLGMKDFRVADLTAREFHLVNYLSAQLDSLGSKGKAGRG